MPKRSGEVFYPPSLIAKNYLKDTFVYEVVATVVANEPVRFALCGCRHVALSFWFACSLHCTIWPEVSNQSYSKR